MQQISLAVFRNLYLENSADATHQIVSIANSDAFQTSGNALVLSALIRNAQNLVTGANTALTLRVQGSISPEGEWKTIYALDVNGEDIAPPDYIDEVGAETQNWRYPWARVEVELRQPGEGIARILLDVSAGLSEQG